ncbi:hypothetical protein [Streptomyces sp. NPDC048639]|uniref:hypothetical protein n=1 Tax=Streptomyces sp. NPDC048639 TaxID=3365581 RepID=UPI003721C326
MSGYGAIVVAFDDERVTDADGTVLVAVAGPAVHLVPVGERQIVQGLHEIRDLGVGSLRCRDRVEHLLSDHGGHAYAAITDVGDVQSVEDRVTGTGIDGVDTDRALA